MAHNNEGYSNSDNAGIALTVPAGSRGVGCVVTVPDYVAIGVLIVLIV